MENKSNSGETKSQDNVTRQGNAPLRRVVDPAAKYYADSRRKREEYDRAMQQDEQYVGSNESVLAQPGHVMGQGGNSQSQSGFDYRTFRGR